MSEDNESIVYSRCPQYTIDQWRIEDSKEIGHQRLHEGVPNCFSHGKHVFGQRRPWPNYPHHVLYFIKNKQFPKIKYSKSIFHESVKLNMVSNHASCHSFQMFACLKYAPKWIITSRLTKSSRGIVTAHGINISWSRNYATTQQLLKLRWRNLNYQVKQSI